MKYNINHIIILIITIIMLSSCTLLFPEKKITPTTYVLNNIPCDVQKKRVKKHIILVSVPEAKPLYNTTHIIYTLKPYQVSYFSHNEWAETVPQMLQHLLVQTLDNTQYFKTVTTPPYFGPYDYTINTQVLMLQMDFSHCPGTVQFCTRVQIIKNTTNKVIATQQFSVSKPIFQRTPYGSVIAANKATAEMLNQIANFLLNTI